MRKLLLFAFWMAVSQAFAQTTIGVSIQERPSSSGVKPSFEVEIPQASANNAINILERTLSPKKLFRKSQKMVREKDEWIMYDVIVRKISDEPYNVYTRISSFPGKIFVNLFFERGGAYLGSTESSPQVADAASRFVRDFAVEVYRDAVGQELKQEERNLKTLERNLKKMGRQKGSFERKIVNLKSEILELQNTIRENDMRIRRKETFAIIGMDSSEDFLKEQQSETTKMQKENKAAEKRIARNQRNINRFERKGRQNLGNQNELRNEIDRQKIIVRKVLTKLNNIR